MKKLLRMWSVTSTNVTLAVSERLQAQKSLAVKVGLCLFHAFWNSGIWVCTEWICYETPSSELNSDHGDPEL